jgi:RNA polymerase sigma-70 factor (ECF subfamily)
MVRDRRSALVAYARLFAADRHEAEDLVHEAVVKVFARPRRITDVHAAEGYVRQAIRTTFLDQARGRTTRRAKAHLIAPADAVRAADGPASASVDVGRALAALPPRERACAVLRYIDDLPVTEIAAALAISEGSVKRYLSDATRTLRDALRVAAPADDPAVETLHVTHLREERP